MRLLLLLLGAVPLFELQAADRHVSPQGGHVSPFLDWATAATNIQAAINVAAAGDTVWVTNGIYRTGGVRLMSDATTNRIAIPKALTVRSVNGPEVTVIEGAQTPGTTNGASSIRCVWITNNATLSGFTLTNGSTVATGSGGGACCQPNAIITNCVIAGNTAGGYGGGVYQGLLQQCTVSGNVAKSLGGGVCQGILVNCVVRSNRCLQGNGGGLYSSSATNCAILANWASSSGGGAYLLSSGRLQNCTLVANQASTAGGMAGGLGVNSIIYFNAATGQNPNYSDVKLINCCTWPLPQAHTLSYWGPVVIDDPMLFSDGFHVKTGSPCIGRGSTDGVSGVDVDGQAWENPPTIGCDQRNPQPILLSGPRVVPDSTPGGALVVAEIAGDVFCCRWKKDGAAIEDDAHYGAAHTAALLVRSFNLSDAGSYQVVASNSLGVVTSAVVTVRVACVDGGSPNPTAPYSSWETAARTIQDAVEASEPGMVVLVAEGIYDSGGRYVGGDMTNRVVLDKAVSVMSLHGPDQTILEGAWDPVATNGTSSVRCAWIGEGAALGGLTLRNGSTPSNGGGVWSAGVGLRETVVGCIISNCQAAANGGGAYQGRLRACTLWGNSANKGGGIAQAFAYGCTIAQNAAASNGGGAYDSRLQNCQIAHNASGKGGGLYAGVATACLIATNSGAGVYAASARNCRLVNNTESGAVASRLDGCLLRGNIPYGSAGGTNVHCTILESEEGTFNGLSTNCIIWFNAKPDYSGTRLGCIVQPARAIPQLDRTNFYLFPNFLSDGCHLAPDSPCRSRGMSDSGVPVDVDGQTWSVPAAIGCDEWTPEPVIVSQPRVLPDTTPGRARVELELAGQTTYCWWVKDGVPIENNSRYDAAHTSSLIVRGFDPQDAGTYQVVASNSFGVVTSALAVVTIACVNEASPNPAFPFDSWSTAAHTIQEAVDAVAPGTTVLVADGIYAAGGRALAGDMSNRVVLDKAITVLSQNGPDKTVIEGAWDASTTTGSGSIRCVWLGDQAVLGGFTLRNGSSPLDGGGLWSAGSGLRETVIGCVITNCRAGGHGGGVFKGGLRECVITGNTASARGGGAAGAILNRCLVQGNTAITGGGIDGGVARNCRILSNSALGNGGGAAGTNLLLGCVVALNQAAYCAGIYEGWFVQCTVVSNSASVSPIAGTDYSRAFNSIVYYNLGQPDSVSGGRYENVGGCMYSITNLCTPFVYPASPGISNAPQLLDLCHVAATSPCRNAGADLGNNGVIDIDGERFGSPPTIGCDEVIDANLTGPLSVSLSGWPEVAVGGVFPVSASATGRVARLQWDFGDGVVVSNLGPSVTHIWTNTGEYVLTASVFNADHPAGVSATLPVRVLPQVAPQLAPPVKSGLEFRVQFSTQPGLTYALQSATNLVEPVIWQTVRTLCSTGDVLSVTDTASNAETRFYRVQTQ